MSNYVFILFQCVINGNKGRLVTFRAVQKACVISFEVCRLKLYLDYVKW